MGKACPNCGNTEVKRWRKGVCAPCNDRQKYQQDKLDGKIGKLKVAGPCTSCAETQSPKWYNKGTLCKECYHKEYRENHKIGGPCFRCETTKASHWYRDDHKNYICMNCYGKEKYEENVVSGKVGQIKISGPCKICTSVESIKWYHDGSLCNKCYHIDYFKMHKSEINEQQKVKKIKDIEYKLGCMIRTRTSTAARGLTKGGSAIKDLGCTVSFLRSHLETQFKPGMTWDNMGLGKEKWQIDHIIALGLFNLSDPTEFAKACHYKNLQPLWQEEHLLKTKEDRRKIRAKKKAAKLAAMLPEVKEQC